MNKTKKRGHLEEKFKRNLMIIIMRDILGWSYRDIMRVFEKKDRRNIQKFYKKYRTFKRYKDEIKRIINLIKQL